LLGLFLFFTDSAPAAATQQDPPAALPARSDAVRVFLDCSRCDQEFLRREVTFIDYVRNREDADVHVLVTTQETGGGGTQFTLQFIGLGPFQGIDYSLTYAAPQMATADETRRGFARVFKLGLIRYAAETSAADRLHVTFEKPRDGASTQVVDRGITGSSAQPAVGSSAASRPPAASRSTAVSWRAERPNAGATLSARMRTMRRAASKSKRTTSRAPCSACVARSKWMASS